MNDDLHLRPLHRHHEPDPAFRRALRAHVLEVLQPSTQSPASGGPNDEGEIIMLVEDRRQSSEAPRRRRPFLLAAAAAAVVLVIGAAVVIIAGDGDDEATVAVGRGATVFDDRFDDGSGAWQPDPEVTIEDGRQVWRVTSPGQKVYLRPEALTERLVNMEVTAEVATLDEASSVGVYCRKGAVAEDFYYYFRLGPGGASIGVLPEVRGTPGETLNAAPDVFAPEAPFSLTARCVDVEGVSHLTLLLDGEPVLEATYDRPIPPGFGALEVQAGAPGSPPSEVAWDRFVVRTVDD